MLLDMRWSDGEVQPKNADRADTLFTKKWPGQVTDAAYNDYFNSVVSLAERIGLNPIDDSAQSTQLRSLWWNRFAVPPPGSGYEDGMRRPPRRRALSQPSGRTPLPIAWLFASFSQRNADCSSFIRSL